MNELRSKEQSIINHLQDGEWKDVNLTVCSVFGGDIYFIMRSFDVYCFKLKRLGYDIIFNEDKTQVKLEL